MRARITYSSESYGIVDFVIRKTNMVVTVNDTEDEKKNTTTWNK